MKSELFLLSAIATVSSLNFTMRTFSSHSLPLEQREALRRHPQISAWRRAKRQIYAWSHQPLHDYFDEFYLGSINVGNPGQELWLAIDSGSSIMWVIDGACRTAECTGYPDNGRNKKKFFKTRSRTFKFLNRAFSIHYITGWTSGTVAEDTIRFGGYDFHGQQFGLADKVAPFLAQIPIDGVFGLGLPSNVARGNMSSPMEALMPHLTRKVITVYMNRKIEISRGGDAGYLSYGSVDTTNCQQEWKYISISSNVHWRIPIEEFRYGTFRYRADNEQALVDTGSSYIGVPASVLSEIVRITGATFNSKLDIYVVPCSGMWTLPDLVFQLNKIRYTIPSAQYVIDMNLGDDCALTFYPMKYDRFLGISWILGAPFIRTFCTIFDYGEKRVGFAVAIPR